VGVCTACTDSSDCTIGYGCESGSCVALVEDCDDWEDNDEDSLVDATGGCDTDADEVIDFVCGCYDASTEEFSVYGFSEDLDCEDPEEYGCSHLQTEVFYGVTCGPGEDREGVYYEEDDDCVEESVAACEDSDDGVGDAYKTLGEITLTSAEGVTDVYDSDYCESPTELWEFSCSGDEPEVTLVDCVGVYGTDWKCAGGVCVEAVEEEVVVCPGTLPTCADGEDNDSDGTIDLDDTDDCAEWGEEEDEGGVSLPEPNVACREDEVYDEALETCVGVMQECEDLIDNDGDGEYDYLGVCHYETLLGDSYEVACVDLGAENAAECESVCEGEDRGLLSIYYTMVEYYDSDSGCTDKDDDTEQEVSLVAVGNQSDVDFSLVYLSAEREDSFWIRFLVFFIDGYSLLGEAGEPLGDGAPERPRGKGVDLLKMVKLRYRG